MNDQDSQRLGVAASWLSGLARGGQVFAVIAMVVMTTIIGWQIFGRFVLNDTPKWSEQLAGIIMVYLMLIGGAVAVWEQRHIALDVFLNVLPDAPRYFLKLLINSLIGVLGAMMMFYGVKMAAIVEAWTIPTLGLSQSLNYWAFPVAGAMITVFAIAHIVALQRGDGVTK